MITLTDFAAIDNEVKNAIHSTLDDIKKVSQMNYILYLANGDYRSEYDTPTSVVKNPNVIDYRGDLHRDETRLKFLSAFLSTYYSFPTGITEIGDEELRMNIEFMVYSHIWESDNFLKDLGRLSKIVDTGNYEWNIVVPPMGKHDFIRNNVRTAFDNKKNPLADIIKKGFHTSIRNAFAHSQYFFSSSSKNIWLDNYGGQSWELRNLSFDDWSKRFVYSTLLSFHLLNIKHERRINIVKELGSNTFPINLPPKGISVNIIYYSDTDDFRFEQKQKIKSDLT